MSDGQLSQEEIDALLGQKKTPDGQPSTSSTGLPPDHSETAGEQGHHMSDLEQDVLGEIGNISFGSAATALSTILNQKVEITTPTVRLVNRKNLGDEFPTPHVSVLVKYTEGFQGSCLLVIKTQDASVIASLMMGGDGKHPSTEISEMEMSAVQEAMNQMMGSSSTAMSTVFSRRIDISPPQLTLMDVKTRRGIEYIPKDEEMFEVSFSLKIGSLVDSHIMQLVPIEFGKSLVNLLISQNAGVKEKGQEAPPAADSKTLGAEAKSEHPKHQAASVTSAHSSNQTSEAEAGKGAGIVKESSRTHAKPENIVSQQNVHPAEFSNFEDQPDQSEKAVPRNMDLLMDIPLDVSVELGRTKKTVKEVLELGPGSIIELDKLAGEAIDILVNQKYVAKGEVVVVDENFGIRITEILDHYERIKDL